MPAREKWRRSISRARGGRLKSIRCAGGGTRRQANRTAFRHSRNWRGMADNVALLQMDEAREFQILMAGKLFESWIGRPAHNLKVADLSIDRARALQDLFAGAVS